MTTTFAPDPAAALLFGKGRRELLAVLFGNPDSTLYLRELARLTRASAGTTQRELRALTSVGLVRATRRGRQVFFQANQNSPLFASLRTVLDLTMGVPDLVRTSLAPLADQLLFVGIFGSIASGASKPTSDVDVLIIGAAEFSEVADALAEAEHRVGRSINPALFTPVEFARRVKEKAHFITSLLHRPLIPLIGELPPDAQRVANQRVAPGNSDLTGRGRKIARNRGSQSR